MVENEADLANFPFFPLFVRLRKEDGSFYQHNEPGTNGIPLDNLYTANNLSVDLDFQVGKFLMLPGKRDILLTDEELIQCVCILNEEMGGGGRKNDGPPGEEGPGHGPGHGRNPCFDYIGMQIEEFLSDQPKDGQGRPIVDGSVFQDLVEDSTHVGHHFVPGNIKFYFDGHITIDDQEVCSLGGVVPPEIEEEMADAKLTVQVKNLNLS
jgi:hypothetical protein